MCNVLDLKRKDENSVFMFKHEYVYLEDNRTQAIPGIQKSRRTEQNIYTLDCVRAEVSECNDCGTCAAEDSCLQHFCI